MQLVRWALVPLSGIAVWYAVLVLGIVGSVVIDSFCPPELVVSGACTATWHSPAVETLMLLCTAIVSAAVVVIPALVAPARRFEVAVLAYGCGAAFALYAASLGYLWRPFFVAALGGSASLWLAAAKWRKRRMNGREHS